MNTWKYHLFCQDDFYLAPKLFYKVYPAYHICSELCKQFITICYCGQLDRYFYISDKFANLPLPSYLWTSGVAPQPPAVAAGLNSVPAARRVKRQSCAHTFERLRDWRQTGRGFVIILAADGAGWVSPSALDTYHSGLYQSTRFTPTVGVRSPTSKDDMYAHWKTLSTLVL